jgi:hypothetical protein
MGTESSVPAREQLTGGGDDIFLEDIAGLEHHRRDLARLHDQDIDLQPLLQSLQQAAVIPLLPVLEQLA